jgi:hypothetical protein
MTPTLLLISSTLGLIPLLLRGELPAGMTPLELLIDTSLRTLALCLGIALVGYVLIMELGDEPWNDAAIGATGVLAAWTLMALGGEFVVVARHRFWVAARGTDLLADRGPHKGANWAFAFSQLLAFLIAITLIGIAMAGRRPGIDAAADTVFQAGVVSGASVIVGCYGALKLYDRIEGRLPTTTRVARCLDGQPGNWIRVTVTPDAGLASGPTALHAWCQDGTWFFPVIDARRLVRAHRNAADSASRPSTGLHARRLTLNEAAGRGERTSAKFGIRVWDPAIFGQTGRRRAHSRDPFDDTEYGTLPREVRGYLVPISAETMKQAGFTVAVEQDVAA